MEYKATVLREYGALKSLDGLTIQRMVWYQMVKIRAKTALHCIIFSCPFDSIAQGGLQRFKAVLVLPSSVKTRDYFGHRLCT